MQLNFQRLGALIRKETIQILRDRRFIMLFLGLTFVQLFVYSYSASKTVYHLLWRWWIKAATRPAVHLFSRWSIHNISM
jgi:1-acyl-sn-glycerol-3-phosphate acyltransferase